MTGHRPRLALPALAGLATIAILAQTAPGLVLINESPSLPEGLYVRAIDDAPHAAVVAVAPPAEARSYLASLGAPADARLLKRVAARGGDHVCARPGGVELPGRWIPAKALDRRGAPLPRWDGCRPLAGDELFLLGDSPDSFDSRYFGPVRRDQIEGVYREVLRW